jgi:hypothetical protein
LRVRVEPSARRPGYVFGWSYITATGPVVAYYEPAQASGEWRFQGYEAPGARESGRAVA